MFLIVQFENVPDKPFLSTLLTTITKQNTKMKLFKWCDGKQSRRRFLGSQ